MSLAMRRRRSLQLLYHTIPSACLLPSSPVGTPMLDDRGLLEKNPRIEVPGDADAAWGKVRGESVLALCASHVRRHVPTAPRCLKEELALQERWR